MDLISNLAMGLGVALTPINLLFCFVGALLGTLIGVLPGLGPVATIAMLLPITFTLEPTGALIMLAGIYYGAQYGGSTTAILINIPGELSSIVTCIDGHQMARNGRAGAALAIAAISSFFAGCVTTALIAAASPPLSILVQRFGAAEYFSLMVFGLVSAAVLARGSVLKSIAMILVGVLLGFVGTDYNTGASRYTFGLIGLSDGIGFVAVAMGMFGLAEIINNLEKGIGSREIVQKKIGSLMPSAAELRTAVGPTFRGTALGSVLGVLPGSGALLSSFGAYILEKKMARDPTRFGQGAVEGVAAPEAANNAAAQTSFIPMMTLGIPGTPVMAMMIGAMMIHGIAPGPQVMTKEPELFWGLIASMWIGNAMLLVINLPLIGVWVRLLRVPYQLLFPAIMLFCAIGVYSLTNAAFEVFVTVAFGVIGYLLVRLDFELAPLLLGMVLGPLMEEHLRRAMVVARGDPMTFLDRPISLALLAGALIVLAASFVPAARRKREKILIE
jgi:putative tricarboxylic transport membrane protein